ncbi:hypothetical protein BC936DRAFT_136823 [Jimgerdemannia flammicorona]|uniref:Uncharacterized protein n=1 Tax=Jimgerdemannia flammicorona TaxID=994334 RepID=A0A433CYR5_9FUNG|nr:hypothetical protein BC936DRAFT_136823 [Jimgerdemannia flammicorona]
MFYKYEGESASKRERAHGTDYPPENKNYSRSTLNDDTHYHTVDKNKTRGKNPQTRRVFPHKVSSPNGLVHRPGPTKRLSLEAVHLNIDLLGDALVHQKLGHLNALVARELENLSKLLVVDKSTVARELLLESLQKALRVILFRETLNSRQRLAAVALLNAEI